MALTRRALLASAFMAPASRVAVGRCPAYGRDVLPALARMMDQLGGLGRLVANKTVAIKVNLGGPADRRLGSRFHGRSNWVHPDVIGSVVHLLGRAGARRIRLVEGARYTADPLEEHMIYAGYEPGDFERAAARVEFENINVLNRHSRYTHLPVPGGGLVYPGFLVSPAVTECDVFVSLAKLKEHVTTGITLSMKNCFGLTPTSIYGNDAGESAPNEAPRAGRGAVLHAGERQPASCAPAERDTLSSRHGGERVPRIVVDIVAARPVHLAIIDGIETIAGGEAVSRNGVEGVNPGLLIAGLNAVNTDAVAMAAMGYDPMAAAGQAPFERCASTLALAEACALGSRDVGRIEVVGGMAVGFDFARRRH